MLKEKIQEEIKLALRNKDELRLSTLRFLLSFIKNEEISKQRELSDEEIVDLVQRQIKQHRESIEAFRKGGREDLIKREEDELKVLNEFLPDQLAEEELKAIIAEVRENLPAEQRSNFGSIMGLVMKKVKGRTTGEVVSRLVNEILKT